VGTAFLWWRRAAQVAGGPAAQVTGGLLIERGAAGKEARKRQGCWRRFPDGKPRPPAPRTAGGARRARRRLAGAPAAAAALQRRAPADDGPRAARTHARSWADGAAPAPQPVFSFKARCYPIPRTPNPVSAARAANFWPAAPRARRARPPRWRRPPPTALMRLLSRARGPLRSPAAGQGCAGRAAPGGAPPLRPAAAPLAAAPE
jgi:hypothetical protein